MDCPLTSTQLPSFPHSILLSSEVVVVCDNFTNRGVHRVAKIRKIQSALSVNSVVNAVWLVLCFFVANSKLSCRRSEVLATSATLGIHSYQKFGCGRNGVKAALCFSAIPLYWITFWEKAEQNKRFSKYQKALDVPYVNCDTVV
jgi:hypothetical protein